MDDMTCFGKVQPLLPSSSRILYAGSFLRDAFTCYFATLLRHTAPLHLTRVGASSLLVSTGNRGRNCTSGNPQSALRSAPESFNASALVAAFVAAVTLVIRCPTSTFECRVICCAASVLCCVAFCTVGTDGAREI